MKKPKKALSLESILSHQLKDQEVRLRFEERRFYLDVARLISELRAKTGVSQVALAQAAGVSQPLIARIEKGDARRTPTFDTIFKILKALGYQLEISVRPSKKKAA